MAKADDEFSTIVWISWRDAIADLKLALSAYGSSETLAEELLAQWIGTRKIPWDCEVWKGPVAEVIALVEQTNRMGKTYVPVASTAHHKGDPEWFLLPLKINSQESEARDTALGGAKAGGIKISHTHFRACLHTLALQPEAPREREEAPEPSEKKAKKMGRQMRRILPVLKKFYPPHGKAPDDVSTEAVRVRVNKELAPDSRNQGQADASWDTVNRALGRDK